MGAVVKIEVYGDPSKGAINGAEAGILAGLIQLNTQAKALVPVKYGQLRNTLMYKMVGHEGGFNDDSLESAPAEQKITVKPVKTDKKIEGYQGTNSDHWFPEFGTRYQIAQPFERPAKEIVFDGRKADEIMKKYCKEEMIKEFRSREVQRMSI